MLVEFKVANFRSFHGEQVFSLVASSDPTHPDSLIPCDKFKLLKTAAVYGANAAGKSNLMMAMYCMRSIILNSATTMTQGDQIPGIYPYRLCKDTRTQPSSFAATLVFEGKSFEYFFSATMRTGR